MARPSPAPAVLADARPTPNLRSVTIRANLLPDEVVVARRTEGLRRHVVVALGALVAVLVAWYGLTWWQTHSADRDLDAANAHAAQLQGQQRQYSQLITAQSDISGIHQQLSVLMNGDTPWKPMLAAVRSQATGLTLTNIDATVTTGAAAIAGGTTAGAVPGGIAVLNQSGRTQIGTLAITGTAKDKQAVAGFVDRLAGLRGLATPYPANLSADSTGTLTFTVDVVLTTDALGGRFAAPTPGGK